ncbi:MAG: DUF72 domain-containing protein [Spirochaetes bacterium]|nr:DUF72 domain-containing protein [Spirochaetota bacterium]
MIYIGTCGYSYKDWEDIFYTKNEKNKLEKYFNFFDLVEIDSTFYNNPQNFFINYLKKIFLLKDFSGKKLIFKINSFFTHQNFNEINKTDSFLIIKKLEDFFYPLIEIEDNVLLILFQFPYSVKFNQNFIYNFNIILEKINEFKIKSNKEKSNLFNFAIEVRNKTFINKDFLNYLNKNNLVFVNIDQPLISSSIPLTFIKSSKNFMYFRLHGRNYENWFKENTEPFERYNYLYKAQEIIEIFNSINYKLNNYIKSSVNNSENNFILTMNNHYKAKSILNAFQFEILFNKAINPDKENNSFIKLNSITNLLKYYSKQIDEFTTLLKTK